MAGLAEGFDTKGIAEAKVLSPLDFAAFFSDIATYDYQILGHQISKLFSALDRVDWAQVLFTLTGKVVGSDPMRSDIRYYKAGFEVASKAADLVADGVPPPTAAAEEPPFQNIFSIPSLMDFLLTNTDAGHVKTLAVKAADFAMKLSTTY